MLSSVHRRYQTLINYKERVSPLRVLIKLCIDNSRFTVQVTNRDPYIAKGYLANGKDKGNLRGTIPFRYRFDQKRLSVI